jgi:hypothetical protein
MSAVDSPRREKISTPPPPTVTSAGAALLGGASVTMGPQAAPYPGPAEPALIGPAPRSARPPIRVGEDGFLSEAQVDAWVRTGAATRTGCLLTAHDGGRFLLRDAVRVLGRRNGDTDPYGFTGRVEAIRDFIRRGANVSTDALRLGQAVYDIEYGFLAVQDGGLTHTPG